MDASFNVALVKEHLGMSSFDISNAKLFHLQNYSQTLLKPLSYARSFSMVKVEVTPSSAEINSLISKGLIPIPSIEAPIQTFLSHFRFRILGNQFFHFSNSLLMQGKWHRPYQ